MKIASTNSEKHFLPITDHQQLHHLRQELRARGYGRAKVAGCIDFLLGIDSGHDDVQSATSRALYRKMLHELVEQPTSGPHGGRTVTRATPGYLRSLRRRKRSEGSTAALLVA